MLLPIISVECHPLESIEYGIQQLVSDGTISKATYGCDEGYTLKGSAEIICQTTGFWEVVTSTCGTQTN